MISKCPFIHRRSKSGNQSGWSFDVSSLLNPQDEEESDQDHPYQGGVREAVEARGQAARSGAAAHHGQGCRSREWGDTS